MYATDAISPDGKRMAVVRHTSKGEYLEIGPAGGHGPWQRIYRSSYYLTTDLYWATPNLIAFGDSNIETNTIDVRTHRVHFRLATATSFNVSNDGRWIAWSWAGAPDAPPRSASCRSPVARAWYRRAPRTGRTRLRSSDRA